MGYDYWCTSPQIDNERTIHATRTLVSTEGVGEQIKARAINTSSH